MPIRVVTPSGILPVSLELALRHIGALDHDLDLVQFYLLAATELVEDYTGRSLITKTYCLDIDTFPVESIELRRSPLVSISSLKYYAPGETSLTTWAAANYRADITSVPGRLMILPDVTIPDVDDRHDAVQITFTAGYGTKESSVDSALRLAIIQLAHHSFDNRVPIGDVKMVELPMSLRRILDSKKVRSLVEL